MILAALSDYYARLLSDPDSGISEPGYSMEKISYAIVLDRSGNVVAVNDIRDTSGKKPVPKNCIVPASFNRSGDVFKPFFLWDKTSYALGVSKIGESARKKLNHPELFSERDRDLTDEEKKKAKRLPKEFAAFKKLHLDFLAGSDDIALRALLSFLVRWEPSKFNESDCFLKHGEDFLDSNVIFLLDGDSNWLHERPASRALQESMLGEGDGYGEGICLVTGETAALARLHPVIKGVKDAQSSGASIVSFNALSYLSYKGTLDALRAKKKENNSGASAPISRQIVEAYTTALNYLLRSRRLRVQIGDATVVFWAQADDRATAQAAEDMFAGFIDPKDEDIREASKLGDALELVRQGRPLRDLNPRLNEGTRIFVLGLAPNASRLSIRFWETGTLQMFAERLALHFSDLELQPQPWSRPPSIRYLAKVTAPYRRKGERGEYDGDAVSPLLAGELTRAVLTGYRYPRSLLTNLIMRMRADGEVSGVRVALCKGVLTRAARLGEKQGNKSEKGVPPVSLDQSNTDPGYLLGRLFSVLENVQKKALGDKVNATIRDRYYGAASATPASVFPVLLRNTQHHLSRLRKEKIGLAVNMEKEIGEIINLLDTAFPKSLGIEAQGHFAIGYYHQTKARFASKDALEENDDTDSEGENE